MNQEGEGDKLSPFFIPQNKEVSNKTTTFAKHLKYL